MNSTKNYLTDIEKKYAQKHFKKFHRAVGWLWIFYVIIALFGFIFIFTPLTILGVILSFFGVGGAILFKKNSIKTKFELHETTFEHTGTLNSKVKKVGKHSVIVYYLDHYVLVVPAGLELYIEHLLDKYINSTVTMTFAVMDIRRDKIKDTLHTPLVIADDLSINAAIEKHGERFLVKDTLYLCMLIFSFIALTILFFSVGYMTADYLNLDDNMVVTGALLFASIYLALHSAEKLFNHKSVTDDQRDRFT